MNKKTTLVVMAAGMGSRFGGLKQIEPIGPNGEIILDYSIYDAKEAGFSKAVFIIKKEIEKDMRAMLSKRVEKLIDVDYAFQELEDLPEGVEKPSGREKPWGTTQAVLSTRGLVDTPFAVVNADDYYGKDAYRRVCAHLQGAADEYCMAGFRLKNTVTAHGTVSRGVCEPDGDGYLKGIVERLKIRDMKYTEDDGQTWLPLPEDAVVSMNMWGFQTDVFGKLEARFKAFFQSGGDVLKKEALLPTDVNALIQAGEAKVKILPSADRWYGITYREDKPAVMEAVAKMTAEGLYQGL
jgi:NDP-sugar pyrophosphorylase family protein